MSVLFELRNSLTKINQNLFSLLDVRKQIVQDIQLLKELPGSLDTDRELSLFSSCVEKLSSFSNKELLIFSLIIEEHAGDNYPAWSKGEHLHAHSSMLIEMINPFLLFSVGKLSMIEKQLKPLYLKKIKDFNG